MHHKVLTKGPAKPRKGLLSGALTRLKSSLANIVEAHHQRALSLRVYAHCRVEGRVSDVEPVAQTAPPQASVTRDKSPGWVAGFLSGLRKRSVGLYAAHEARLIALRVYDRARQQAGN